MSFVLAPPLLNPQRLSTDHPFNENGQHNLGSCCLALVEDKTLRISDSNNNNNNINKPFQENNFMYSLTGLENVVYAVHKAVKQGLHVSLRMADLRELVQDKVRLSRLHLSTLPQIQGAEEESCIPDNNRKDEKQRSQIHDNNTQTEEEFVVHEVERDEESNINNDTGIILNFSDVSPSQSSMEDSAGEKKTGDLFLERFFPNLDEEEGSSKSKESCEKDLCWQLARSEDERDGFAEIRNRGHLDHLPRKIEPEEQVFLERFSMADNKPLQSINKPDEQPFLERFSAAENKPLQRIKAPSQSPTADVDACEVSPAGPIQSSSPNFIRKEPPVCAPSLSPHYNSIVETSCTFSPRSDNSMETLSDKGFASCSQTTQIANALTSQSLEVENRCKNEGKQCNENDPCHVPSRRQPQVCAMPCSYCSTNETISSPNSARQIHGRGFFLDTTRVSQRYNPLARSCPSFSQDALNLDVCLSHQFSSRRIVDCPSEKTALLSSQARTANSLDYSSNSPLSCKSPSCLVQQEGDNCHRCAYLHPFCSIPSSCHEIQHCTEHHPQMCFSSQVTKTGPGLSFGNSKGKEKKLVWLSEEEAEIIRLIRLSYVKETSNFSSSLGSPALSSRVPDSCDDGAIYDRKTTSHISSRPSSCSVDELMSSVVDEGIPALRDADVRWRKHGKIAQSSRPTGWEIEDERHRILNHTDIGASESVHSPRISEWRIVAEKQRLMATNSGINARYFAGSTHSSSGNDWEAEEEKPALMRDVGIVERETLGDIHCSTANEQDKKEHRDIVGNSQAYTTQMGNAASCIQYFWRNYLKKKIRCLEEQKLIALKFVNGMESWQEPRLQVVIKAMNPEKLIAWYQSLQTSANLIQKAWRKALRRKKEHTLPTEKLPRDLKDLYELIKRRHINKGLALPTYERFLKLYERLHAIIEGARIRRRLKSRRLQIIIKEIKEIRVVLHDMSQEKYTESSPNFVPQLCTQLQQKLVQLHTALSGPQDAARVLLRRCPSTPLLVCTPNGDPSSAQDSPVQASKENVPLKTKRPVGQLPSPELPSVSTGIELVIPKESGSLKPNEPSPKVERKKLTISLTRHLRRARQNVESQRNLDNNPTIENTIGDSKPPSGRIMPCAEDLSSKENNIPGESRRMQENTSPQTISSVSLQERPRDVNVPEFEESDALECLTMPKRPFLRRKSVAMAPQKLDWSKVKPMVSSRLEPELSDKLFKPRAKGTAVMKTNYSQVKSRLFNYKGSSSRESTDVDEAPTTNKIASETKGSKSRKRQTKTPDSDEYLTCHYEQGLSFDATKNGAKDSGRTHMPKISSEFNQSRSHQSHAQYGVVDSPQEATCESLPAKSAEEMTESRRNQAHTNRYCTSRDVPQYGAAKWQRLEDNADPDFVQQNIEISCTTPTGDANVASAELERTFEQVILKNRGRNISLNSLFPADQEESIVPRLHLQSNIFRATFQEKRKLHEMLRREGRATRLQRDRLTFVSVHD